MHLWHCCCGALAGQTVLCCVWASIFVGVGLIRTITDGMLIGTGVMLSLCCMLQGAVAVIRQPPRFSCGFRHSSQGGAKHPLPALTTLHHTLQQQPINFSNRSTFLTSLLHRQSAANSRRCLGSHHPHRLCLQHMPAGPHHWHSLQKLPNAQLRCMQQLQAVT